MNFPDTISSLSNALNILSAVISPTCTTLIDFVTVDVTPEILVAVHTTSFVPSGKSLVLSTTTPLLIHTALLLPESPNITFVGNASSLSSATADGTCIIISGSVVSIVVIVNELAANTLSSSLTLAITT